MIIQAIKFCKAKHNRIAFEKHRGFVPKLYSDLIKTPA